MRPVAGLSRIEPRRREGDAWTPHPKVRSRWCARIAGGGRGHALYTSGHRLFLEEAASGQDDGYHGTVRRPAWRVGSRIAMTFEMVGVRTDIGFALLSASSWLRLFYTTLITFAGLVGGEGLAILVAEELALNAAPTVP